MKNLLIAINSKFSHSALAIRYIEKYCDENYSPELREYTINQHHDDIVRDIMKDDYTHITFSCYIWNYEMILKIAEDIKRINSDITITLGGPEVSYDSDTVLETYSFIDLVIFGEGEETYKELFKTLYEDGDISGILGIAYRLKGVHLNKARPFIDDLDIVPFPYDDLVGLEHKKLYYESSRGCPYQCQYCLSSTTGHVRYFSLERVKKDMKFFIDLNVEQVKFVDRTFNANPKRALEIFKFLHDHDNQKTNFHFEIVASLLNDETLDFLKEVREGLFQFEIGVQTTHEPTMVAIKRNIKFVELSKTVRVLSDLKTIHLHLDLIAGLPYEDYNTFLNSFESVYQLQPEKLQLGFLKLLKGSGLRLNQDLYGYVYSKQSPYEIFFNDYITYKELIKLKYVEEIVEMYYNTSRFKYSLDMIIKKHYNRAVDFYIEFSTYWLDKGYFEQPHKVTVLYEILLEFYRERFDAYEQFKGLVIHDYYSNHQKHISGLFDIVLDKTFTNICYQVLKEEEAFELKGNSPKQWLKHTRFIPYNFDVLQYIKSLYNDYTVMDKVLMYDYQVTYAVFQKSRIFDITNEFYKER